MLYVSPLKALINDQYDRLELLCERPGHPGAPLARRRRRRREGAGAAAPRPASLLITPESLEALFVTARHRASPRSSAGCATWSSTSCTPSSAPSGARSCSRCCTGSSWPSGRRVPRIGLSATLGDFAGAAEFLRPGGGRGRGDRLREPDGGSGSRSRGYRRDPAVPPPRRTRSPATGAAIADHLFRALRGTDNLVFANSRAASRCTPTCSPSAAAEAPGPERFFAHHGSLSKEVREDVEARLKGRMPVTAICTSTLELGIDVGSVDSVAQIGPPPSPRCASGSAARDAGRPVRSCRCTSPSTSSTPGIPAADELRPRTRPDRHHGRTDGRSATRAARTPTHLHLSTLIQQVLSIIAQHGGATAAGSATCSADRPVPAVTPAVFAGLLRAMGRHDLLEQAGGRAAAPRRRGRTADQALLLLRLLPDPADYRLVADGYTLGTLPVDRPIQPARCSSSPGGDGGSCRRHRPAGDRVDRGSGGRPEFAGGGGPPVADEVRQRMRDLYLSTCVRHGSTTRRSGCSAKAERPSPATDSSGLRSSSAAAKPWSCPGAAIRLRHTRRPPPGMRAAR